MNGYKKNHSGRTYNFLFKKPYGESGKAKASRALSVKTCSGKAMNTLQLVFDSDKTSSEPPERLFIPPANEPPERSFVKCNLILDTCGFTPTISRQTSPKEDLAVDTFFNILQIIQQISAVSELCGSFQTTEALDKCCRLFTPHTPP